MNLYQMHFTRTGRQELDAGWKITAASTGTSKIAGNTFKGIASNLIELRNHGMPSLALDVRAGGDFYFITQVNYMAKGADTRGNAFAHGYVMSPSDYYELVSSPEMICGIEDSCFETEFRGFTGELPLVRSLDYRSMSLRNILEKYGISEEQYVCLLKQAMTAAEQSDMPLCVHTSADMEEWEGICKDVMFLILSGIPHHLRMKLDFFSASRRNCSVYLSKDMDSPNVFDLDTASGSEIASPLDGYLFYQDFGRILSDERREGIFAAMADFLNAILGPASRDVNGEKIDLAYRYCTETRTIEHGAAFLSRCLRLQLKNYGRIDEYAAEFLDFHNQLNMPISSKMLEKDIVKRFQKTDSRKLTSSYCVYYALDIVRKKDDRCFEQLYGLRKTKKEEYEIICTAISEKAPDYFTKYYLQYVVPKEVTDFGQIREALLHPEPRIEISVYFSFFTQMLRERFDAQFRQSKNDEQRLKLVTETRGLLKDIPGMNPQMGLGWEEYVLESCWKGFEIVGFQYRLKDRYESCDYRKFVQKYPETEYLDRLLNLGARISQKGAARELIDLFFTRSALPKASRDPVMKEIRAQLQKAVLNGAQPEFDTCLGVFYDFAEERFLADQWLTMLLDGQMAPYLTMNGILEQTDRSQLLRSPRFEEKFGEALQALLDDKSLQKDKTDEGKRFYQALRNYGKRMGLINEPEGGKSPFQEFQYQVLLTGVILVAVIGIMRLLMTMLDPIWVFVGLGVAVVLSIAVIAASLILSRNKGSAEPAAGPFEEDTVPRIVHTALIAVMFAVLIVFQLTAPDLLVPVYIMALDAVLMIVMLALRLTAKEEE